MSEATATVEDRLAAVEARLADLERRVPGAGVNGVKLTPPRHQLHPDLVAYYKRIGADGPPPSIEELHRLQLEEGADPNSTFCREEIERMREE